MMSTYYCYQKTPIGDLLLAGNGEQLELLGFPNGKMRRRHESHWKKNSAVFKEVRKQLASYFAGELKTFELDLSPIGTDFQRSVWLALTEIPYGETWSYGQLAKYIQRPKASRAVGAANGRNPIPVIIPCHRVIGSSGKLTGFGGGLQTKEFLLCLESRVLAPELDFWQNE